VAENSTYCQRKLLNQGVGHADPKLMGHKHSRSQAIACLICRLPGQSGATRC